MGDPEVSLRANFVCGGVLVPASRFRVHPVESALRAEGWQTQLIHGYGALDQKIPPGNLQRAYRAGCRVVRAVRTAALPADVPVMVQRLALPWWGRPERRLGRRSGRLLLDFDDAVFLGGDGLVSRSRRKALDEVFAESAHVVAGNSWLAQAVGADVPVSVIPTCIDTHRYAPAPKAGPDRGVARIGWIGTSGNFPYLQQLEAGLGKLRRGGLKFDFLICSDHEDSALFQRLGARYERWSAQGELGFLQSLDIGLMPLADDDWCRGKCSFKMIQYMAVGCPVVASAVGMNVDVLAGEVGGRLVTDDWATPLAELLQSPETVEALGRQARQRAVERYDLRVALEAYRDILTGLQ